MCKIIPQISATSAMIPVLESERLRLRGHTLNDFEHSAAMWSNLEVVKLIQDSPSIGNTIVWIIQPDRTDSISLAKAMGFKYAGTTRYRESQIQVLERSS